MLQFYKINHIIFGGGLILKIDCLTVMLKFAQIRTTFFVIILYLIFVVFLKKGIDFWYYKCYNEIAKEHTFVFCDTQKRNTYCDI